MSINTKLSAEQIFDQRQQARRLVGFAISMDPTEIIEQVDINGSGSGHIVELQTNHVIRMFKNTRKWQEHKGASSFLLNGIGDARTLMKTMFEVHPSGLTLDQAIRIGKDERTIVSIATLASQSDKTLGVMMRDPELYVSLTADHEAIDLEHHVHPSPRDTCPEVGPIGQVEPSPLFNKFVPWATELAARSLLARHPHLELNENHDIVVSA
jgi:hypothetical protein